MYEIDNFKVSPINLDLEKEIKNRFHLNKFSYDILHRSIDARDKDDIKIVYRLKIDTTEKISGKNVKKYVDNTPKLTYLAWNGPSPVIVGFGPAGMFAGLYLARCGAKPIIIERGSRIEKRKEEINKFFQDKKLNPNSNVQFGEGGAGTFSDGKLNSNVKDPLIKFILNEFYLHGALQDITYDNRPHIGTDYLEKVVKNIRIEIESLGGTFYFNHQFVKTTKDLNVEVLDLNTNEIKTFKTNHLILGIGHSARDTFKYLYEELGLNMEAKSFSMGVRCEHNAKKINESQYGKFAKYLPTAYYKLATHIDDRGIYSFCMCPGGYVLPSTSEAGTIVLNGMSNQKRDGDNSNSAILVDVKVSDYYKDNVLDGFKFQELYERKAFLKSNDYKAPANLMKEFLNGDVAKTERSIKTSYPHGVCMCDITDTLPDFVTDSLKKALPIFNEKLEGFTDDDAILISIESRSSSPVRILRDSSRVSSIPGIYPIGEGAGYAGGITSSALDGLKTAIKIVEDNK